MAINICFEAFIRLFFEFVRFFFGDVTLIFREGFFSYLDVGVPVMVSRLWLIFLFVGITLVFRTDFIRNIVILSIPAFLNLFSDMTSIIGTPVMILSIFVSAVAWAVLVLSNEKIHPLLRVAAAPVMMVLGGINAVQPFSIAGDVTVFFAFTYMAEIAAFSTFIILGLIILVSPTFICSALNKALVIIESYRYEGIIGAWSTMFSAFLFIKNKALRPK